MSRSPDPNELSSLQDSNEGVVRIYRGAVPWERGQLPGEIRSGMWGYVSLTAEELLQTPPQDLWSSLANDPRVKWMHKVRHSRKQAICGLLKLTSSKSKHRPSKQGVFLWRGSRHFWSLQCEFFMYDVDHERISFHCHRDMCIFLMNMCAVLEQQGRLVKCKLINVTTSTACVVSAAWLTGVLGLEGAFRLCCAGDEPVSHMYRS